MIWTTKIPDKPGWWWIRQKGTVGGETDLQLAIEIFIPNKRRPAAYVETGHGFVPVCDYYKAFGTILEFSSTPIPEPTEQEPK